MDAAGHQVVARAFRRAAGEDGRLEFHEAALGHAAAEGRDHLLAQDDVLVQFVAAQIQEAVLEAEVFRALFLAVHEDGKLFGHGLDDHLMDHDFHFARGHGGIHPCLRRARLTLPVMVMTLS